jgi:sterol desaturase/sphingolipid hydroxylase (fatty acid hydroxylase superfamily)
MHVANHRIPFLWELHKIHHHADEMTILTATRHHPLENALATVMPAWLVALLGFDPLTVIVVMQLRSIQDFLLHCRIDSDWGFAGKIFVSPRAHWVHHGADAKLHNRNFSADLVLWDRIFGTRYLPDRSDLDETTPLRLGADDGNNAGPSFFPFAVVKATVASLASLWPRRKTDRGPGLGN